MEQEKQQFEKIDSKSIFCEQNKQAKFLCSTKQCLHMALSCGDQNCKCSKCHSLCDFTIMSNLLTKIELKRSKITQQLSKALKAIDNIYLQAIQQLSLNRQKIQAWRQNFGLSSEQTKLVLLLKNNQKQKITGDFIFKVKHNLQNKNDVSKLTQEWINNYWKGAKSKFQSVFQNLTQNNLQSLFNQINCKFKWDPFNKSHFVKIQQNVIEQTKNQSNGQRIAFLQPNFQHYIPQTCYQWGLKFIDRCSWVGVGICRYNKIKNQKFSFQRYTQEKHGHYIIANNGYCWSSSNMAQNHTEKGFTFTVGDIIYIRYEPKKRELKFIKNKTQKFCCLKNIQELSDDFYVPCINFTGVGDKVQIVEVQNNLDWSKCN